MDKKTISAVMSELGKRSAKSLTPEQREKRASNAAKTRWAKRGIINNSDETEI